LKRDNAAQNNRQSRNNHSDADEHARKLQTLLLPSDFQSFFDSHWDKSFLPNVNSQPRA
jgi:hypothetical protein